MGLDQQIRIYATSHPGPWQKSWRKCMKIALRKAKLIFSDQSPVFSGWGFGTFFVFPYIGNNHPNWFSYFSGVLKPPSSFFLVTAVLAAGRWFGGLLGQQLWRWRLQSCCGAVEGRSAAVRGAAGLLRLACRWQDGVLGCGDRRRWILYGSWTEKDLALVGG